MKINVRSVRYGAVLLAITGIISQVILFFFRIMLTRLIGAEGMGLYQLIFPYNSLIMSLAVTGVCVAVSRSSAEFHAQNRPDAASRLVSTALGIFFTAFAAIAVVTLMFATPIAKYFVRDERVTLALLCLLPCLFFTGVENVHKHYFYGQNVVNIPAVAEVLEQLVRSAAILLLLWLLLPQPDEIMLALIVGGMVLAEIASSTFLRLMYRRRSQGLRPRGKDRGAKGGEMARAILKTSVPISLSAFFGNLLSSLNVILIPQRLLASGLTYSDALAQFGVLSGMALPMLMLPGALINGLSIVIVPRLSETIARGDRADMRLKIDKALRVTTGITLPAMALMIPLGGALGALMYGVPGMDAYMLPLGISVMLGNIQGMTGSLLNGCGFARNSSVNGTVSVLIQLGCTYFLAAVPGIGINGVVAGIVAGSAAGAALNLFSLRRRTKSPIAWWRWFVRPGLCALAAGVWANMMYAPLARAGLGGLLGLLLSAGCGVIVYLAGTLMLGGRKLGLKKLLRPDGG